MTFLVIFRLTPIEHDSHNVSRAVLMKILSKSLTNLRFPSRPQGEQSPYVDCLQRYRIWNFPSINLLRFLLCFHLSMSRPVPSPSCAQSKAKAKASLKSTAIKSAAFSTFFESNLARYLIFAVTFYQTIWMFGLLLLPLRVEKGMFVVMITWKKASAKHRAEWIYMPCTTEKERNRAHCEIFFCGCFKKLIYLMIIFYLRVFCVRLALSFEHPGPFGSLFALVREISAITIPWCLPK